MTETEKRNMREHCAYMTRMGEEVFDEQLMYFTAHRENVEKTISNFRQKFKHALGYISEENLNRIYAQFISNLLFGSNGKLQSYLEKGLLHFLKSDHLAYLEVMRKHPMKFGFFDLVKVEGDDFFRIKDIFTEERHLVYSPGITQSLKEFDTRTWLLYVGYNGMCTQTFGPMIPLGRLQADELFTFGVFANPKMVDERDLVNDMQINPLIYAMLIVFPNVPFIVGREEDLLFMHDEDDLEIDPEDFISDFHIARKGKYFRMVLRGPMGSAPHYATLWYDAGSAIVYRTACTDSAYSALSEVLHKKGFVVDFIPAIRCNLNMMVLLRIIFNKFPSLVPFYPSFQNTPLDNVYGTFSLKEFDSNYLAPKMEEEVDDENDVVDQDKVNLLAQTVMSQWNEKRSIDHEGIARDLGFTIHEVQSFANAFLQMMKKYE
jgi:hypothetical protein